MIKQTFIHYSIIQHFTGELMSKPRSKQATRSNEYRIKRIIMRGYDKTTRPVVNDKSSLDVQVAISLYHILDTVS